MCELLTCCKVQNHPPWSASRTNLGAAFRLQGKGREPSAGRWWSSMAQQDLQHPLAAELTLDSLRVQEAYGCWRIPPRALLGGLRY